ncbi:VOC family protein [Nocardioides szechwanensis]|uniref:PhnB protein n=1 Tax=Nocardioides szechwanensis TaxID=1005944 RepID=A0A1G9ZMU4_9ACTN|nr:VOC family protein [Nocardioides szechwanensis]GEP33985.1 VOC family protein [Nocardioides szechwanensis]SDN22455.1 PhnB protein [Nocardioides szechwanensis]
MATLLNPYLHFDGTARDAITFYQSVFGGELALNTFGEMGMQGEQAEQVMHAQLEAPDLVLMASDTPPGETLTPGSTVTLSLSGDDDAKLRGWFETLADGGQINVPLEKQMWGDVFGQLADKYGVTWMVNINQPG